ncbi:MAG: hypothetical protein MUD01_28895 [Chloroflexaceae bacterium]|jgi:hypothetical protein|nr:hypothetical protein [Chloroflexaceae bacterium]
MATIDTVDRIFARVLRVTPQPEVALPEHGGVAQADSRASRAFSLSLLISALRCTLQYVILPVVLPLIGVMSDLSLPLVIVLDVVALLLLVRSLRYYWRTRHPRRFDMLPLSGLILLIILGSLGYDLWLFFS